MGLTKAGIQAEIAAGGGGGSTFLDDAQFFGINQSLGNGAGPYEINTGIVPALDPNTRMIIRVETALVIENDGLDRGYVYYLIAWSGSVPVPPASLGSAPWSSESGTTDLLNGLFLGWSLNAAGELILNLSDSAPENVWADLKILVSYQSFPFTIPIVK